MSAVALGHFPSLTVASEPGKRESPVRVLAVVKRPRRSSQLWAAKPVYGTYRVIRKVGRTESISGGSAQIRRSSCAFSILATRRCGFGVLPL